MDDTPAGPARADDFSHLDDPGFLNERARLRGLLEYEPEDSRNRPELERRYDAMTEEFLRRARIAWQQQIQEDQQQEDQHQGAPMEDNPQPPAPPLPARLLAVEVLLTAPETLGNDALEADLYILRDQLRTATTAPEPSE